MMVQIYHLKLEHLHVFQQFKAGNKNSVSHVSVCSRTVRKNSVHPGSCVRISQMYVLYVTAV